jgi:hypothetical protein
LLDSNPLSQRRKQISKIQREIIQVREVNGEIVVMGLIEEKTSSLEEMMQAL